MYIMIGVGLLLGCGERQAYRDMLSRAEAVMADRPDSALQILDSLGQHETDFGRHFRMQYQLHRMNAENKTNAKFTTDSLANDLADYFDSHGTANERMLAHYLLGRTYSDMGEAPRAIDCYLNAIDAADTTATDFDFYTLGSVYSQMATIFRSQLLLSNEIEARQKACYYDFRADKPLWGIYNQAMSAGAYILLNKKDSAEFILKSALNQYRALGYKQQALRFSRSLMYLYTENLQRLDEAKVLMDQFEAESELFNEYHELPPSQRQFYDYKGKYYEGIHNLDSAEHYYRKAYYQGMDVVSQSPMYRGLLSVFSKRHQADSIAKYATLYCMVTDSSIALKDRDVIARMTASYNYSRLQNEVRAKEAAALKTKIYMAFAFILLLITCLWLWHHSKEKQKKKQLEYDTTIDAYQKNLRSLNLLKNAHQTVIATIQQELNRAQKEGKDYQSKLNESQNALTSINAQYEAGQAELQRENAALKAKINELERNKSVVKHSGNAKSIKETEIVQRIKKVAKQPTVSLTEKELESLVSTVGQYYPALIQDLSQSKDISQLGMHVCLLDALKLRPGDIANLLNISSQQVSNLRYDLNLILFNEASAKTLYTNLVKHYGICLT